MSSREARRRRAVDAWRVCGRKRAFRRLSAADAAAIITRCTGEHMMAYPCRYCGRWHIAHYETHRPPPR